MFRCALVEIEDIEFSVATDGESYTAQLPIGTDDETGCRYSILVSLQMIAGQGPDTKELVFCVLEADPETDQIGQIWDGRVLRRTITDAEHRRAVLGAVFQLSLAVVDEARPRVVTMVTFEPGLPEKALMKYQRIVSILAEAGYRGGKSDVWHGQHTWMMERCV